MVLSCSLYRDAILWVLFLNIGKNKKNASFQFYILSNCRLVFSLWPEANLTEGKFGKRANSSLAGFNIHLNVPFFCLLIYFINMCMKG